MTDDEGGGEAWSDILARRSPEGRAVVDEPIRAEQAVLAIQARIMAAIEEERRDYSGDWEAFDAASAGPSTGAAVPDPVSPPSSQSPIKRRR